MRLKRRDFISLSVIAAASGIVSELNAAAPRILKAKSTSSLTSAANNIMPITVAEREARVRKAQALLLEHKMDALLLDCGTSMTYFTGLQWWPSERTMIAIIPAKGQVKYICPAFELDRLKEKITIGNDILTWEEDENPYQLIVKVIKDAGFMSGNIAIEERMRFFIMDGIRKVAPELNYLSGDPVTIPCRIIKSPAELFLMQKASDITLKAIQSSVELMREGMEQAELSEMVMKAQNDLGGSADFALCLFGKSTAFPHGIKNAPRLKKGDMVLMDCGCSVEGYCSDITRTLVFGATPTRRQIEIWNLEKRAQAAGFAAAKVGAPFEAIDEAARNVIIEAGYGPGYQLPGLPHRTGHGIGMDGHEWGNAVKGNKQLLEPGMCFSIEPTISIIGEFGVRFEDCVYMTESGPKWFTQPSNSIDHPFGE